MHIYTSMCLGETNVGRNFKSIKESLIANEYVKRPRGITTPHSYSLTNVR